MEETMHTHLRRKPAAESISLVCKSPSRPEPICQKDSSGESSNPEKWFETSNNNIKTRNIPLVDGKFISMISDPNL
jgi:hypothetical protein